MKINKYIMGLLMSLPFVSSCDNHIYEDASWHSWMPVWSIAPMEKSCHMKTVFPKEIHQRLCSFLWIRKVLSQEKRMLFH